MRNLEALYALLNSIHDFQDKVTYRAWEEGEAPELPFICYLFSDTDNVKADDGVYVQRQNVAIELYSKNKDIAHEEAIENALNENAIPWDKYEDYIETEKVYKITYDITI